VTATMEATAAASNLLKYLFLGGLYLFIIGLFWAMWRQMSSAGAGKFEKDKSGLRRQDYGAPFLVAESGSLTGKQFALERDLTIGRSPGHAIVLADRFASSHHATVRRQGNEIWLLDEGSTNGTFLNGFRITSASPLTPGDTFVVGETTFRLVQG